MKFWKFGEKNFVLDPDSLFWAVYEEGEDFEDLREKVAEKLLAKLNEFRFTVDVRTLYLNVIDDCNANCPYCYIPRERRRRKNVLSIRKIEEALEKFSDVENVIFHGAEPILAREIIFEVAETFDLEFGIQTNCIDVTEKDLNFFAEREFNVGVSLDAPKKEINDALRGKGHFEKAVNTLKVLSDYDCPRTSITTITKINAPYLAEMVEFLSDYVSVALMNPVRGTTEKARELRENPIKLAEKYIKAVERSIELTKEGKRIVIGDFANIVLGFIAPTSRVLQCDISPCGGGKLFVCLAPDGIYPCGEFLGFNEFRKDLEKIDPENPFPEMLERVVERIPECTECWAKHLCGSPCPAEIYSEGGSMFNKSYYCEFYKALAEHAARVIARDDEKYLIKTGKMRKVYSFS
ncbi:Radical SAM domain protein [Ferroglobus placidus DSM 10642]|uniref:Radical SAM domain protein n=1 Tax=Ferroglobus placidus (strain DSM 10642 / AEDII12DO) TaxID=589924 RepID=D3RZ01_FERPA|nr:peptide-modifying radical SAM enzyme CbpB [Ferroglobus placidus]ADC65714.1 Radical SAM domain protein [Ferroglobus placidus DSM 10642]